MNRTLPRLAHYLKTLLAVTLFACAYLAVSSFTFPTDILSVKTEVIKCYPNPATSIVNFEFQKHIDKSYVLQVYSFVGKKMEETPIVNNKITFDLTEYYRGIYVYQLRDKTGATVTAGKFQVIK